MSEEVYDVTIIGAGPAGGSAALHSSRLGLKTLVLEEHDKIGEPVHCGECLSHYCTKNTSLNLPEHVISKRVNGIRVIFPDGSNNVVTEKGYILEKHLFEQWLSGEAEKLGAKISLGSKLTDLKRENNIWKLKCGEKEFKSKILIDASGVAAVVSNKLNLNPRFHAVIGMQYELQDIPCPEGDYMDFYIWPKLAPEGYLWIIPKSNNRANVGLVTSERNKARTYLEEFVKKEKLEEKVSVKTFGGLIPASGPLKNRVADGLMLIGDAAGLTSPLFEGGSHLGLKSGEFAAQVAREALERNDLSKNFLQKYVKLCDNEFPDYEKIIKGREALYAFSDDELNTISKLIPKELGEVSLLQRIIVGLKVLLFHPKLFLKGFAITMKAFGYSRAKNYGW